jgi:hypothetical protein
MTLPMDNIIRELPGVTREQLQDLDMMSIDYSFYLEEMYKKSTVYLRDKKLNEILSK